MPLTSNQKHYIKKNYTRMSPEDIAADLRLPEKEILNYLKKRLPQEKYRKIAQLGSENPEGVFDIVKNFNFRTFFANNISVFILLFFLVAVSYFNALGNDFVSDDISGIKNNPDVGKWSYVFSTFGGWLTRFIIFLTYKIGGANPLLFHSYSIVIHLLVVFALYILLSTFFKRPVAIGVSAIFAVHPIHAEVVTWISGMSYAQYSLFFLISFIFYVFSDKKPRYYYFSILFFLLALFINPTAMSLFVVYVLYELCFRDLKKNWRKMLPFLILSFSWVIIFSMKIGTRLTALSTEFYQKKTSQSVFIQVPTAIGSYLKLIFWPQGLSLYQTELTFDMGVYILFFLTLLAILGLIFYGWKRDRQIFFWLSFFIIALSPTLTPFGVSWIVAERYVYLGSLGIFVSIIWLFVRLMNAADKKYLPIFYSVFAIIIIALSARTIMRNIDWKNEDNLWLATAKVSPSGAPIHNNLGDVWARRGNYPKAIEEFTKATQINPGYADAYHNLANVNQMTGNKEEAIKYYNKALSINPNIWQSYQNLAAVYFELGDKNKSLEYIQKALAINPNDQNLQANLKLIQDQAK